jgi:aminobenzoyl-glutamate utilization protein B
MPEARRSRVVTAAAVCAAAWAATVAARGAEKEAGARALEVLDQRREAFAEVARQIWGFAEVGYQEHKSSALLQSQLRTAGFEVRSGVAGMPTAFVASWGQGTPVVAFLAEFDALPGLSQAAAPERQPLAEGGPGHGCGHHLLGTASVAAAVAVKEWLAAGGPGGATRAGTIRVYGTPAEEGGSGKVYMVREGLFEGVDAALAWHPADRNAASTGSTLANVSAKFRFRGVSAHASASPEQGRSALDGVEAMDVMVNMMREHLPESARIHYVITGGGKAPNVVPDFAEVYYVVRHPDITVLDAIWDRVVKAAQGAALGTGTTVDHEVVSAVYNMLPNERLAALQQKNLERVGGVVYSAEEQAFAERIRGTLSDKAPPAGAQEKVRPMEAELGKASTDLGDVSWSVPTAELSAATWVPGTPAHSWQAVACGGIGIGTKGMMVAARALALTAVDLFSDPAKVAAARAEFETKRAGRSYVSRIGDRKPALDYRKN